MWHLIFPKLLQKFSKHCNWSLITRYPRSTCSKKHFLILSLVFYVVFFFFTPFSFFQVFHLESPLNFKPRSSTGMHSTISCEISLTLAWIWHLQQEELKTLLFIEMMLEIIFWLNEQLSILVIQPHTFLKWLFGCIEVLYILFWKISMLLF